MMRAGELKIDDAHRVDTAVGGAGAAIVGGERDLAIRRHGDVVRPLTGRQIELAVGDLVAVDVEQRHLVRVELGGKRALADRA